MKLATLCIFFLLCACASSLTQEGGAVRIVSALTPENAKNYSEIGLVVASQTREHDGDENDCRTQLQNRAGRYGASLLIITKIDRQPCVIGQHSQCVMMIGRAYRKN